MSTPTRSAQPDLTEAPFMSASTHRTRRPLAVLVTALVVAASLVGLTTSSAAAEEVVPPGISPVAQRTPGMVTADSLPTAQIGNGVVWTQAVSGDTVYVGGDFTTARPPGAAAGTGTVNRSNMLAYSISTGQLTSFNPTVNNKVYATALSPDGKRLYVGGAFSSISGSARYRLAAFDTATGALISSFAPAVDYNVKALVATNDTVYVGGLFTKSNAASRPYLAAFSAANGALLDWAPVANKGVFSLALTPDKTKIIAGGQFSKVNGATATGLAAIDASTGVVKPWQASTQIYNAGDNAAILSVKTDGTYMYANGYTYETGTDLEGTVALDPTTGAIAWVEDCHGDTYDNYPAPSGVIYTVSHAHYCGNIGGFFESAPWDVNQRRALAFTKGVTGTTAKNAMSPSRYADWGGLPSPSLYNWFPDLEPGAFTGQDQAAWTVTGNSQYVVMGGEFPRVNGQGQQGLARFAVKPPAPAKRPPSYSSSTWVPTASALPGGGVRIGFQANSDTDDHQLTYKIVRDGNTASPIYTKSATSTFWNRPMMGYTDTAVVPGQQYSYRVYATDGDGNTAQSNPVTVTAAAAVAMSGYAKEVRGDNADLYWRLGETSGTTVNDWAGGSDGLARSGVTRGAAGAISGDADKASTFNGSTTATVATQTPATSPQTFSVEAWFKTTSTLGGKIIGYGSSTSGSSVSYDRHVYLDNSGRLNFGVYNGTRQTISTTGTYRDGTWHHVVATLSPAGMKLYVDGQQRAANLAVTGAQPYEGYWRIGGDNLTNWPNKPTSAYIAGQIDEVAVYGSALSAGTASAHYALGKNGTPVPNVAPTAAFTSDMDLLAGTFNASGSTDSDGSVASYSWDFGDGTAAGSGATPQHTYAAPGTYQVKLTVTDNDGATGTVTHPVTATVPANALPTAVFTTQEDGLRTSLDASGSTDSDGTIASYTWDFGDGTPAGSGATPQHVYAAAGTYQVKLTVTDNVGGTGTITKPVTVADPPVFAEDHFDRTLASGLGSADSGGAWTLTGGASLFSVGGGTGNVKMSAAGGSAKAYLGTVTKVDQDISVDVQLDKVPAGATAYTSVVARRVGTSDYRTKVLWRTDGLVSVYLSKTVSGVETTLKNVTLTGMPMAAGESVSVRLQVVGTSPATVQTKVWKKGPAEPAAWTLTTTDTTAALASAGGAGVEVYLGSTATNAPIVAGYDDFVARNPQP